MPNIYNIPDSGKDIKVETQKLMKLLWEKAENLQTEFNELENELELKYNEIQQLSSNANLHQIDVVRGLEKEYFKGQEQLLILKGQQREVMELLDELETGNVSADKIGKYISDVGKENEEKLSKRKQRILEEKERFGIDPHEIDYGFAGGPQVAHPSTGRNLKRVKGANVTEQDFYTKTADTHGGKVSFGKSGNHYISSSGNYVRKK